MHGTASPFPPQRSEVIFVNAQRSTNKEERNNGTTPISIHLSKKGVKIDTIEQIATDFRRIRNTVPEMRQLANNILFVARNEGFPNSENAIKIACAVFYMANVIENLSREMKKKPDESDMEEFVGYLREAAFSDFLKFAWKGCEEGVDTVKERYEIISEALKTVAGKYGIRIKLYEKITKEDAGVDDIKKIEPDTANLPKLISRDEAEDILARFIGEEINRELRELMKIPEEIYVARGERHFNLSDKEDFRPFNMLKVFFGGPGKREASLDAGYGISMQESAGHSYILFIDTSRRVAVKATVFSMHEHKSEWDEFRRALKAALDRAEKISKKDRKTFYVSDLGMLKKESI